MKKFFTLILAYFVISTSLSAQCWMKIAGTHNRTFAIKYDGTLWVWGYNGFNTFGTGNNLNSNVPIQVGTDNNWLDIAGGSEHSIGLKKDGTLWAWGEAFFGQLGQGTLQGTSSTPIQVGTDTDWVAIDAGLAHSIALKSDGRAFTWGSNGYGQIGVGATNAHAGSPTYVISDVMKIEAGGNATYILKSDSTLWGWGRNNYGQINGQANTPTNVLTPTNISSNKWKAISANEFHSVGIRSNGTLWAWGSSNGGISPNTGINQVGTANNWTNLSVGRSHSIVLNSAYELWIWGSNTYNQLGEASTTATITPVRLGNNSTWSAISAGQSHSFGIRTDGTAWAWGQNTNGQIGNGISSTSNVSNSTLIDSGTSLYAFITGPANATSCTQPETLTSSEGESYTWSNGGSSASINVSVTSGSNNTYTLTVEYGNGCSATASHTIAPIPAFIAPPLSSSGPDLMIQFDPNFGYAWYLDGNLIAGANAATFTATQNGIYSVEVTNLTTQCSSMSNTVTVTGVGTEQVIDNGNISVYPNPSTSVLNIQIGDGELSQIRIMTPDGKIVLQSELNNTQQAAINIEHLASGLYFLTISHANSENSTLRFVKQ